VGGDAGGAEFGPGAGSGIMAAMTTRGFVSMWMIALGLGLWLGLAAGCTPRASDGGFDSSDPASKLYAIVHAGQTKDRTKIPQLIEQLASDDQAVRMYTIEALRRITGQDMGYVHYAHPALRQQAIDRWVAAYRSGQFDTTPASSPASSTTTTPHTTTPDTPLHSPSGT
jgi:hypothetical protein